MKKGTKQDDLDELDAQTEELRAAVNIDPLFLKEEFVRIPGDLAYWNSQFAKAHREFLLAKLRANEIASTQRIILRADNVRKLTVDDMNSLVDEDIDVRTARADLVEKEYERERIKGIVDAIRTKRDMVVSLGAHIRIEMGGDPMIRDQHRQYSESRRRSHDDED